MSVERWLQIHVVTLCLLGALFIALNTGNLAVPLGVLFAGVTSILFTDTWKWFQLNRLLGNLAAVGAVAYALRDFLASGSEGQLLAIASLLVYLQVILFYQAKTIRLYWQIILLSLLQVVVGAALHLGLSFGVLLLLYTMAAVSTLVLFFIHRETEQHVELLQKGQAAPKAKSHPELGRPTRVTSLATREELNLPFRAKVLGQQIAMFTAGAMLFASVFFYTVPRHSKAAWTGTRGFSHTETGFSRDVDLQQMGQMLQNNAPVMRVWLTDALGRPVPRLNPYFAGEILTAYRNDGQHASWIASGRPSSIQDRSGYMLPAMPSGAVIQKATMNATYHNSLFAITPIYLAPQTSDDIKVDPSSRLIFRQADAEVFLARDYTYETATTGIRDGRQVTITPHQRPSITRADQNALWRDINDCLTFDEAQFPGLSKISDEIVATLGEKDASPILTCRALEDHFLAPGAYTYSLNLNVLRDRDLDPIEDFVVNHRTGHCQYFASALVMMLRSQGIPARMVVGYRGDEYNEIGHFYQVRQRNAHAWVEAYLYQDQVPSYETTGGTIGKSGAWLRLDPTPGREAGIEDLASWTGTTRDWLDYVDMIWSDYVIGLNQQRQQTTLYGGETNENALADTWLDPNRWTSFYTFASWLGIHIKPTGDHGFRIKFDWRAGLTAMILCGVAVALNRFVRWYSPRFDWSAWFGKRRPRGLRSRVEFYARLEELLTRRGRSRRPAETAREYVDQAVRELAIPRSDALHQTVESFYRVRFGEAELSDNERESIEHALAELERTPTVERDGR